MDRHNKLMMQLEDIFPAASPEVVARRKEDLARKEREEKARQERLEKERRVAMQDKNREVYGNIKKALKTLGFTKFDPPQFEEHDVERYYSGDFHISGKNLTNQEEIFIRNYGWSRTAPGRLTISGEYPKTRDNKWVHVYDDQGKEVQPPRISITQDKTPEQMVADISRRFLPVYRQRLQLVKDSIKQTTAHEDLTTQTLEKVKGKPLSQYEKEKKEVSGYDIFPEGRYGKIKASGDKVELEVSNISAEQAIRIVNIIREKRK